MEGEENSLIRRKRGKDLRKSRDMQNEWVEIMRKRLVGAGKTH